MASLARRASSSWPDAGKRDPDAVLAGAAGFGASRPGQVNSEILQLRVGQARRDLGDPRQDRTHRREIRRLQQVGERIRGIRRVAAGRAGRGEPERWFGEVLRHWRCLGPDPGRPQRPGGNWRPGLDRARQRGARPDLGRPDVRVLRWLASQDQVDGEPVRPDSADARVPGASRPRLGRGGQPQRGPPVAQHRMRGPDAGGRRQYSVSDREHGLDQGSGTGRGPRVADVRADRAEHRDLPRARPQRGKSGQLGVVAGPDRRPAAFDELHVAGIYPGHVMCPPNREQVCCRVRFGQVGLAVRRDAPAQDLRVDGQVRRPCVSGPHQQHHAAALAGQEARRVLVVDPHVGGRQQAGLGQADQIERVDAQVDPACHGDVKLSRRQRQAGRRHRGQRGRACRVHRQAAAAQAELAADGSGQARGRAAGEGLCRHGRERGEVTLGGRCEHPVGGLGRQTRGRKGIGHDPPRVWPAQPHRGRR